MQNLASIQPRTSLVKFARSPRTDPSGPVAKLGPQVLAAVRRDGRALQYAQPQLRQDREVVLSAGLAARFAVDFRFQIESYDELLIGSG